MGFIHLKVHSTYSLLQALPNPKQLASHAKNLGFSAAAITEIGNVFSAADAAKAFPANGLQPIMGAQVNVAITVQNQTYVGRITLLAQNQTGWENILQLITTSNIESACEVEKAISLTQLQHHAAGVICLTGGARFGLLTPLLQNTSQEFTADILSQLATSFTDRLYLELQRHEEPIEQELEPQFLALAEKLNLPLVATNDVRFLTPDQTDAFNALVCIGEGVTVDDPEHMIFNSHYHLKPAEEMQALFADLPEAVENTTAIAQRCGYWPEAISVKEMFMPQWDVATGESVEDVIRAQASVGLELRLKHHVFPLHTTEQQDELRQTYTKRLEEELEIIINMGFAGYFLITSDFIKWAKDQNIPVGPGRGSGAGSVVAWALLITDLDPIRWDLYFERFLNPERVSLPDFDVDFCQERRDEVIQYVRDKYGADYVAQIITFGSLKAKACIRDVGRVLQLPYGLVSKIAAFVPEGPTPPPLAEVVESDERLQAMMQEEEGVQELIDTALQLEGCLRHASTHAAGVIISDRPISKVSGLYHDPRSTLPATQYSMGDAEYAGLVKFDFLGLKTLTTIQYALTYARASIEENVPDDILQISLEDEPTYDLLCAGQTVGVFQIESQGMTELTKKMIPRDMEALSALVALYRPGPLGSGMVDDYINVRHGKKKTEYPHPLLEPALKDTFGVPVYQEQIMRMARDMAGYSLGGADMLRRAMGKKKPEEMAKQRKIFTEGAAENNQINSTDANRIFDLMAVFAGYGFNKAHSMAYALISYQTAYLKAHFPLPFMAATMTLDKGNTDKLMRYRQELNTMGYKLHPPCVNQSLVNFKVEANSIRHALSAIKGAGEEAMALIVQERKEHGKYTDIWDFCARQTPHTLTKKNLEVLIKAGALDNLLDQHTRMQLLQNADLLQAHCQHVYEAKTSNQIGLFGGEKQAIIPPKLAPAPPLNTLQQLQEELTVIGFYLSAHPLAPFREELNHLEDLTPIATLRQQVENGKKAARIAGMILAKREMKTKTGKRMGFITLSDESGQEEIVLFPEAYATHQNDLLEGEPRIVRLSLGQEEGRLRLSAEHISSLASHMGRKANVTLRAISGEVLQTLQPILATNGGMTKCTILLQSGNKEVAIQLPHKITFSPELLAQIQATEGVELIS